MKIGIVTFAFQTSTFPLAKYLAETGHEVHLICLMESRSADQFIIDLSGYKSSAGLIPENEYKGIVSDEILNYLSSLHSFGIYLYSKRRLNFYLSYIYHIFNLYRILSKSNLDIIHYIGQNEINIFLYTLLKRPSVFSFHEVLERKHRFGGSLIRLVRFVSRKGNNVIFHSENTKEIYYKHYQPVNQKAHVIKFGLFETYKLFHDPTPEEPRTILYYGIIQPYKGVEFLLDAFRIIKQNIPDARLIIAGRGSIYFDKNKLNLDGIELINRSVGEEELVHLNKRASVVVCPYTSASQSGIPVTSFNFNKPIVATKVAGLSEYINDGVNGILVNPCDRRALAEAIIRLLSDVDFRNKIVGNIELMNSESQVLWKSIANQTVRIYEDEIKNFASKP